ARGADTRYAVHPLRQLRPRRPRRRRWQLPQFRRLEERLDLAGLLVELPLLVRVLPRQRLELRLRGPDLVELPAQLLGRGPRGGSGGGLAVGLAVAPRVAFDLDVTLAWCRRRLFAACHVPVSPKGLVSA